MIFFGYELNQTFVNTNYLQLYNYFFDNLFDNYRWLLININDKLDITLIMKGANFGFMYRVTMKEELKTCKNVLIECTDTEPLEPTIVQLGEVEYLSIDMVTIHLDYGSHAYLNPEWYETILNSIQLVLVELKNMISKQIRILSITTVHTELEIIDSKSFISTERHSKLATDLLVERFGIGMARERETIKFTDWSGTISALLPLSMRYKVDKNSSVYNLDGNFATDTLFYGIKSISSNIVAQIYSHKYGFPFYYPTIWVKWEQI